MLEKGSQSDWELFYTQKDALNLVFANDLFLDICDSLSTHMHCQISWKTDHQIDIDDN